MLKMNLVCALLSCMPSKDLVLMEDAAALLAESIAFAIVLLDDF